MLHTGLKLTSRWNDDLLTPAATMQNVLLASGTKEALFVVSIYLGLYIKVYLKGLKCLNEQLLINKLLSSLGVHIFFNSLGYITLLFSSSLHLLQAILFCITYSFMTVE